MQCESNMTCNDLGLMCVSIFVCNGFGVKKKVTVKKMVKKRKTIKRIIVVKEKKIVVSIYRFNVACLQEVQRLL